MNSNNNKNGATSGLLVFVGACVSIAGIVLLARKQQATGAAAVGGAVAVGGAAGSGASAAASSAWQQSPGGLFYRSIGTRYCASYESFKKYNAIDHDVQATCRGYCDADPNCNAIALGGTGADAKCTTYVGCVPTTTKSQSWGDSFYANDRAVVNLKSYCFALGAPQDGGVYWKCSDGGATYAYYDSNKLRGDGVKCDQHLDGAGVATQGCVQGCKGNCEKVTNTCEALGAAQDCSFNWLCDDGTGGAQAGYRYYNAAKLPRRCDQYPAMDWADKGCVQGCKKGNCVKVKAKNPEAGCSLLQDLGRTPGRHSSANDINEWSI